MAKKSRGKDVVVDGGVVSVKEGTPVQNQEPVAPEGPASVSPKAATPTETAFPARTEGYPFGDRQLYAEYLEDDFDDNGRGNRSVVFPLKTAKKVAKAVGSPISRLASSFLYGNDGEPRFCENPACKREFQPQWGAVIPGARLFQAIGLEMGQLDDEQQARFKNFHHATLAGFQSIGLGVGIEGLSEEDLLLYLQLISVYHDPKDGWAPTDVPKINGSCVISTDGKEKWYCGPLLWSRKIAKINQATGKPFDEWIVERTDPDRSCLALALNQLEDEFNSLCDEHNIERERPFEAFSCASFTFKYAQAEQMARIEDVAEALRQRAQDQRQMGNDLGLSSLKQKLEQAAQGQGGRGRPPLAGGLGDPLRMKDGRIQYENQGPQPNRGEKGHHQGGRR